MGRFAEKYSDEQRRACGGAMLGDLGRKMSAREVCETAASGALGPAPFDVSLNSVYAMRDAERERRGHEAAQQVPDHTTLMRGIYERSAALVQQGLLDLEERAKKGEIDGDAIRKLTRAAQDLERLHRQIGATATPPARETQGPSEPHEQESIMERLTREAEEADAASPQPDQQPERATSAVRGHNEKSGPHVRAHEGLDPCLIPGHAQFDQAAWRDHVRAVAREAQAA